MAAPSGEAFQKADGDRHEERSYGNNAEEPYAVGVLLSEMEIAVRGRFDLYFRGQGFAPRGVDGRVLREHRYRKKEAVDHARNEREHVQNRFAGDHGSEHDDDGRGT